MKKVTEQIIKRNEKKIKRCIKKAWKHWCEQSYESKKAAHTLNSALADKTPPPTPPAELNVLYSKMTHSIFRQTAKIVPSNLFWLQSS